MNRRDFLQRVTAGAATLAVAPRTIFGSSSGAPSDRVRIAMIGPGSRGRGLLRRYLRIPNVDIVAFADVYEPSIKAARELTGVETPAYSDYRRLLDRQDIDAIHIATPLSLHAEHVTAALASGRHVYGEKSLGHTVEHCRQMRDAARTARTQFQVGLQYHYAPWMHETIRRIRAGEIGEVTHIHAFWHRNGNWRRPVPDPKTDALEHLINWRLYKAWSGGLFAELGSHQIDFANWIFDTAPESVIATGGIDYYKDGRETFDNVEGIFRYPGGRTLVFSSIMTNQNMGAQTRIYGTKGAIVSTMADATLYYEPQAYNTIESASSTAEIVERGVVTGATYKSELPYRGQGAPITSPEGEAGNADHQACLAFVNTVRTGARPVANIDVAYASGLSVALANKALDEGTRMAFAPYLDAAPAPVSTAGRP